MPAIKVQQNTVSKVHDIHITHTKSGVFVRPGEPRIPPGQNVVFVNKTPGRVKIRMASNKVLKGLKELEDLHVSGNNGQSKEFEVEDNPGSHDYSVHYKFRDPVTNEWRKGYAEGASSPKIIIVR